MIKNFLLVVALLILALAVGCAKGGNGIVPPPPSVEVSITTPANANALAIYPTQTLTLTATVSNSTTTTVTWSLSGPGTLTPVTPPTTPATATYVAPDTAGSQPIITATLTSDTSFMGNLGIIVVDVTTEVAPSALSVGNGLTQQFTAIAVPDDAPQTFTWSCTANGVQCANFVQDPNVSGLAYYTAQDNCGNNCVNIAAASKVEPTGCSPNPKYCTIAQASLVSSRVNGTFAFQFSGYDSSNHPTAVVGTFIASNGAITSGVEDELTSNGWAQHSITGGAYSPISATDPNSNNAGALTLTLPSGIYPNQYRVVLDGAGDIALIESDLHGTGSGTAQKSSSFSGTVDQVYAFGFTGVDSSGSRVGYAGLIPMDGKGNIVAGLMDVNDNGHNTNSICGNPPCTVTGSYTQTNSVWQLALTSPVSMTFDFFVASGTTSKTNPLTLYAISNNPGANPAVSGTMVLQDSSLANNYNNAAFKGTSVSALTGVNGASANVSLTLGTTDGNGTFSGQFDQNNAGMILTAAQFPPSGSTSYTYAASGTNGRYTFNLLGDPTATTPVAPIPFVLYASGANRGFLLDQSSPSVITGTMSPQGKTPLGGFSSSELPGTYAAATTSSADFAVTPNAANLLVTSQGGGVYNVGGTQYLGPQTVTGTYALNLSGTGTITLTAPSALSYVFYVLDTSGCTNQSPVCAVQDFFMIDEDKTNPNPSIMFAQQ